MIAAGAPSAQGEQGPMGKGKGGTQVSCFLVLATALAPLLKHRASWEGRKESQEEWVCWLRRDVIRATSRQVRRD